MSTPSQRSGVNFEIRELASSHCEGAARLIQRLLVPEFEIAHFEDDLGFGLEAISDRGRLLGISWARFPDERYDLDPNSAEIGFLAVTPRYQRKYGIGSALLERTEQQARESGMNQTWLWALNAAVPFYEGHGYTRISPGDSGASGVVSVAKPLVQFATVT